MKRIVIAAALVLAAAAALFPQEHKGKGRLYGTVTDQQGQPLEGVLVKLVYTPTKTGVEVTTDKEGRWTAAWLRKGLWNVDFEKFGYAPKAISVDAQESQRNPPIDIALVKVEGLLLTEEIKTLLNQGNALFDEQKYDEARAVYESMIEKFPDAYIIHRNIGNCWFAQEKYDLAEQSYLKVLEKDPDNADAMVQVGNTYMNRGDAETALQWYGKIQFDKIDDPIVLYNVGTSYYNNGKFQEALKFYRRSVEIQKNNPDSLYQLGLTCLNLQQNTDAVAAFETYLQVDPDSGRSAQVKGFLEYLKK